MHGPTAEPTNDWGRRGSCPTNRESAAGAKGGHFLETAGVRALAVPQAGRSGLLKLAGRGCAELEKGYRAELMGVLGRKGGSEYEFP